MKDWRDFITQDWHRLNSGEPTLKRILFAFLMDSRFGVVIIFRMSRYCYKKNKKKRARLLHRVNMILHACDLSPQADIGPGLFLPHPTGIVIGHNVKAGNNLTLYQGSTLGARTKKEKDGKEVSEYPVLADDVTIYPNCIVYGAIVLEDKAVILGNSVVTNSVPTGVVVAGTPATPKDVSSVKE